MLWECRERLFVDDGDQVEGASERGFCPIERFYGTITKCMINYFTLPTPPLETTTKTLLPVTESTYKDELQLLRGIINRA